MADLQESEAVKPASAREMPSPKAATRLLRRWHRREIVGAVDQEQVVMRVHAESGWSHRYAFMTMMSAGIAILGLLLSSPAVIIGAMLISPLMGPIIGLGFALSIFDWPEVRRSLSALAAGSLLAVALCTVIVLLSPLEDITPEILARTRPNLFDLLVAIFSALAGAYATIRGRGETIVGVAIATALMPPLAVVGFGLATLNLVVFSGSLALFLTNCLAIALSVTLVAKFYGFGSHLSPRQTRMQTWSIILVFVALSLPLAFVLRQIAWETWATRTIRTTISEEFGSQGRIGALEPEFAAQPLRVRATVFTESFSPAAEANIVNTLEASLGQPIELRLSQISVNQDISRLALDRKTMTGAAQAEIAADSAAMAERIALVVGTDPANVSVDSGARRATIRAVQTPGQTLVALKDAEGRVAAANPGWTILLLPPVAPLAPIGFVAGSTDFTPAGERALNAAIWALQHWKVSTVTVTGRAASNEAASLAAERASRVAERLGAAGIAASAAADPVGPQQRAGERESGLMAYRTVLMSPVSE